MRKNTDTVVALSLIWSFTRSCQLFLPVPVNHSLDELSPSLPPEISIERVEKTELSRGPDYPEVLQVVPQNESQLRASPTRGINTAGTGLREVF